MAKKDWHLDIRDRRDRQSVRTTFKLSKTAWESLDKLKEWHSVTFKDVFDGLCADVLKRKKAEGEKKDPIFRVIAEVTKGMKEKDMKKWEDDPSRKTQVISRGCLRTLEETAKHWQVPRDALVDSSLRFYMVHCELALEEEREKHKQALEWIGELWDEAENIQNKLRKMLDADDPVRTGFGQVVAILSRLTMAIEEEIQGGKPVDEFGF